MCTLEPGPIPRSPVFFSENLILLLLLRWLAGSGQGVGGSYFYFGGRRAEQWLSKDEADFCRYDDVLRFRIRIRGGGLLPGGPHYLLLLLHPCPSALASDGFPPRLQYLDYPTTASPAITFILCLNISLVRAPSLFCQKTFSDMTTCCYFRPYAVLVSDALKGSAIPNP